MPDIYPFRFMPMCVRFLGRQELLNSAPNARVLRVMGLGEERLFPTSSHVLGLAPESLEHQHKPLSSPCYGSVDPPAALIFTHPAQGPFEEDGHVVGLGALGLMARECVTVVK